MGYYLSVDPQAGQAIGGSVPSTAFVERRHASTDHAVFVVVPPRRFFAIDGVGGPMSADFDVAGSALRATLADCERLIRRERFPGPTRRAVAETLWWPPADAAVRGMPDGFADRSRWHWRQLLEIPDAARDAHVAEAMGRGLVRELVFAEGAVAQWLHTGDPDGEATSVRRLFDAITEAGYRPLGSLHVLALVDPRSVPRGRARSILRQPIA